MFTSSGLLYLFEIYSIDSSKMIGNSYEVSNFNRLFLKLNRFIWNWPPVLPILGFKYHTTVLIMYGYSNEKLYWILYSMSPTLNVNPTFFVILMNVFDVIDLQCCNYCDLLSDSSSMTTYKGLGIGNENLVVLPIPMPTYHAKLAEECFEMRIWRQTKDSGKWWAKKIGISFAHCSTHHKLITPWTWMRAETTNLDMCT